MSLVAVVMALLDEPPTDLMTEVVQARTYAHGRPLERKEAKDLAEHINDASTTFGVPPALVLAVIEVESSYDTKAVSKANCKGLMQVAPKTGAKVAATYGLPRSANVALGTAYLASMFGMFQRWDHALMAFNKGPGKFIEQNRQVGKYARRVMGRYRLLIKLLRPALFQPQLS